MTDKDDSSTKIGNDLFKFFNGGHIQMVGWLIQQKNIRLTNQSFG